MLCPNCSKEIDENLTICKHCNESVTQEVVENWKAEIEQAVLGYEEHVLNVIGKNKIGLMS